RAARREAGRARPAGDLPGAPDPARAGRDADLEGRRVLVSPRVRPRASADLVQPAGDRARPGPHQRRAEARAGQRGALIGPRDDRHHVIDRNARKAARMSHRPQTIAMLLVAWASVALSAPASARTDDGPAPVAPTLPAVEDEARGPSGDDARVTELEERLEELSERLKQAEDQRAKAVSPLSINGYADIGFFVPIGNHGVGWVRDVGNRQFPQYSGYSWTFLGDILSTAVISRGEVASLGDAPGVSRFDSVDSGGAPGFIANEVNLRLGYALSERATMRSSINFAPRSGQNFALGDFVDIDVVELEYVATESGNTSVFV